MRKSLICKLVPLLYCLICSLSLVGQTYQIDSLLVALQSAKEDTAKVDILNNLANCHIFKSGEKGIAYGNSALILSIKLNYKSGEALANHRIGSVYAFSIEKKDTSEALKHFAKAETILHEIDEDEGLAALYWDMGVFQITLDKYHEDLKFQFKSLYFWQRTGKKEQIAGAQRRIGNAYVNLNKHKDAIKHWSIAIKMFQETGNERILSGLYLDMALIQIEQGNYAEALHYSLSSLEIQEKKAPSISSHTLRLIGTIYSNLGNFNEALKYQLAALEKERSCYDSSRTYNEIGKTYHRQGNYTIALKFLNMAISKNIPVDSFYLADDYHHIARVYKDQAKSLIKSTENADLIYTFLEYSIEKSYKAKDFFEKHNARDGIAETSATLGIATARIAGFQYASSAKLKYNEAIIHLNRSLALAKEIGLKKIQYEAYSGLAETYESMNDYKKAHENTVLAASIKDSLFSNESLNKLGELRITYETEKAQAVEKAAQEKLQSEMQFAFTKREDSLKFEKILTESKLKQQVLLTKQGEQELQLKQASLDLSNKQIELNWLAFLKAEAELQAEQNQRLENEKMLTISEQEKALQASQLKLQQTELNLKETLISTQKNESVLLMGGMATLILLSGSIIWNIRRRQKAEAMIEKEKVKTEKAIIAHKMADLELQGLRAQLNPHFMFNSLNAIQELILKEDSDSSHLYLSRFSDLLRMLLDNANQPFVPLSKELDFLQLYLCLEKLRIPDLHYEIQTDDSINTRLSFIPNMILQPYIENALWHGLSHKIKNKKLSIKIRRIDELLVFEVEDNGVGRKKSSELKSLYRKGHKSKGMELLSKRFSLLSKQYGADIHTKITDLESEQGEPSGTLVEIEVPISLADKVFQTSNDTNHHN